MHSLTTLDAIHLLGPDRFPADVLLESMAVQSTVTMACRKLTHAVGGNSGSGNGDNDGDNDNNGHRKSK